MNSALINNVIKFETQAERLKYYAEKEQIGVPKEKEFERIQS